MTSRKSLICTFLMTLLLISFLTGYLIAGEKYDPKKTFIPDIETFMQIGYNGTPHLTENGQLFFLTNITDFPSKS